MVSSQLHGEPECSGCFDLFPNCLEMCSLKDKVNTVSGVERKAGTMGSWEGDRVDGKTLWSFKIKAYPRNKGCRHTEALCIPSTSLVTDEPSPIAAIQFVIFYS